MSSHGDDCHPRDEVMDDDGPHRVEDFEGEGADLKRKLGILRHQFQTNLGEEYLVQLEREKQVHEERMQKNKDDMAALRNVLNNLTETAVKYKEGLVAKSAEIKQMKAEVQAITKETDLCKIQKENLTDQEVEQNKILNQEKELLETQEAASASIHRELEVGVGWYRDHLGLEIKKIPGKKLQFVFVNINDKSPDEPYYFSLALSPQSDGKTLYTVSDCCPLVADLDQLIVRLNETNNLRAFVVTLRKKFREICCRK